MKKPDAMLLATFFADCFYSATYPYIYKQILADISSDAVAAQQIVNCISVILFSTLWNKFSDSFFPSYAVLCVLECLAGFCTSLYVTFHPDNVLVYYILDTALFCLITRNIICGGTKLRAMRYPTEQQREHFDNQNNAVSAAGTLIGSAAAFFLHLDFVPMVWLATFGNMIDNIFYICIFLNQRKD